MSGNPTHAHASARPLAYAHTHVRADYCKTLPPFQSTENRRFLLPIMVPAGRVVASILARLAAEKPDRNRAGVHIADAIGQIARSAPGGVGTTDP